MKILAQFEATIYSGDCTPPKEALNLSISTELADYFENPNLPCVVSTKDGGLVTARFVLVEPKDPDKNPLVSFWETLDESEVIQASDVIWWMYVPLFTFEEE